MSARRRLIPPVVVRIEKETSISQIYPNYLMKGTRKLLLILLWWNNRHDNDTARVRNKQAYTSEECAHIYLEIIPIQLDIMHCSEACLTLEADLQILTVKHGVGHMIKPKIKDIPVISNPEIIANKTTPIGIVGSTSGIVTWNL